MCYCCPFCYCLNPHLNIILVSNILILMFTILYDNCLRSIFESWTFDLLCACQTAAPFAVCFDCYHGHNIHIPIGIHGTAIFIYVLIYVYTYIYIYMDNYCGVELMMSIAVAKTTCLVVRSWLSPINPQQFGYLERHECCTWLLREVAQRNRFVELKMPKIGLSNNMYAPFCWPAHSIHVWWKIHLHLPLTKKQLHV